MSSTRRGFTLIELLVVIAIIALLISILLPSLGAAKEQANRVKCAANFHGIGQAFYVFAQDNNDFFPAMQSLSWCDGNSWWLNWMDGKDFIKLRDTYGLQYKMWICPVAFSPADYWQRIHNDCGGAYGNFNPPTSLAEWNQNWTICENHFATIPDAASADRQDPPNWDQSPWMQSYIAQDSYNLMLANMVRPDQPYMVRKPEMDSRFDPSTSPLAEFNSNPPLLSDQCWTQGGNKFWNHGRTWNFTSLDPNTREMIGYQGDVNLNVLFRDGHVESRSPERFGYTSFPLSDTQMACFY